MTTPICSFVRRYSEKQDIRLHMPGHKGVAQLGFEHLDITEIDGADSLYEANGIIAESEKNASELFGCDTYYSTEGSSHGIRAMLYLVCLEAMNNGRKPVVMAARNVHKTFVTAAALLDFDVEWIYPEKHSNYLSCDISAEHLDIMLSERAIKPDAVYITSPDYLGNIADIKGLADVCHKYGVLLIVDNAHGAYLKFLLPSLHPIDLGADICCDSAHKTLPVLTGGAYIHISDTVAEKFSPLVKNALAMFGSTSPSYIIMQSLDMANKYIAENYAEDLNELVKKTSLIKDRLIRQGFELVGNEEIKITINIKSYGYTGTEFSAIMAEKGIICEFADRDYIVFMFTPQIEESQLDYFAETVCNVPRRETERQNAPAFAIPERVMSIRQAMFSVNEDIAVENAEGRVLAATTVGCPPAVPVIISGEKIDREHIEIFRYYGTETCLVVK